MLRLPIAAVGSRALAFVVWKHPLRHGRLHMAPMVPRRIIKLMQRNCKAENNLAACAVVNEKLFASPRSAALPSSYRSSWSSAFMALKYFYNQFRL